METTLKKRNRNTDRSMTSLFILGIVAGGLNACSEETEKDFANEGSVLQITVCDETQDETTRTAYNGLTTTFSEGDAIGIYAVDGNTVVASNVKYTLRGGQWVTAQKCPYGGQYTYYAYYPYTDTPVAPSFTAQGDENTCFTTMIDSWSVASDQGTLEKFRTNDLMIGAGTHTFGRTVSFTMKHKMALAVMNTDMATFSYDTEPDTKYDMAMSYGGKIPYFDGTSYYAFMRPDELTAIGGQQMKAGGGRYTTQSGGKVTESYTLYYSTDDGSTFSETKPAWLLNIEKEDVGQDTPTNFIVTVSHEKPQTDQFNWVNIPAPKPYIDAEPVADRDLSLYRNDGTERGTRTTANCYLVHNPGTYRIPLVYGNAIKDGETNTKAYHATVTGENVLTDFVRHDNQPITAPWIKDNGITVDGAELVWQEVKGLITEVGIDGDFLTFTVSEEDIASGNAVIAAKAGGTTVWSWHIWVTEETLNDLTEIDTGAHTNQNGEPAPYMVSPVDLGQVPEYDINDTTVQKYTYYGTSCLVRINVADGSSMLFRIHQPDYVEIVDRRRRYNHTTYYQWGRKDPMIPGTKLHHTSSQSVYNIDTWDITGAQITSSHNNDCYSYVTGINSIGETIQHPITFYHNTSNNGPYHESKFNCWDVNQNSNRNTGRSAVSATNKTVYDPCPPGFCVPTANLFHYLCGSPNVTTYTYLGLSWCKEDITKDALVLTYNNADLYFPITSYRNYEDGKVRKEQGGYWISANLGSSGFYTMGMYTRSNYTAQAGMGFINGGSMIAANIRPVLEE